MNYAVHYADFAVHELYVQPQSAKEPAALESSSLTKGCCDAFKACPHGLFDGRNGYAICPRPSIPFHVSSRTFITARAKTNQSHGQTAPGKSVLTDLSKLVETRARSRFQTNTRREIADLAGLSEGGIAKKSADDAPAFAAVVPVVMPASPAELTALHEKRGGLRAQLQGAHEILDEQPPLFQETVDADRARLDAMDVDVQLVLVAEIQQLKDSNRAMESRNNMLLNKKNASLRLANKHRIQTALLAQRLNALTKEAA